ncbi:type VII secretion-associated serine protease mycosin [Mycolicibacterium chubuense]|uniref:Thermophilic serine proteinase n=1 Tax=Mycolicibacterium chubuense TaxID=1800 RepID=A0A0J6VQY5_MYCCU|nr:type VII secretion-associated serine protease mycosin [Mycolicibacterium chubuense]KMO72579.1 Thermophilic serine proteinase precursor [Mycolicibacterium chubuense]ORA44743.1 type VII secretion-associated serine protease mycosin [Mycolicibacterium chubuense]SPX99280.1 peptidase S8/S53 subtilisin kexin sedolisin [Mycolicibacterium chubuense]
MVRRGFRRSGAALAVVLALAAAAPPAGAVPPPQVDPGATPPSGTPGPVGGMQQRSACAGSGVIPGTDPAATARNPFLLNLSDAWQHGRGEGQLVAVIDTGVTPGPRLPEVDPGGDFVAAGDGLTDCDGHGTLVAGLIAGQPGPDGFSGVAPAARILSIRQNSPRYSPRATGADPALARATIEVQALARAVVRAADLGARVITIPTAICLPADRDIDQAELGAALRYAAVDRDAVIVAAAGDTEAAACQANPLSDPARPSDPRNWDSVSSLSVPAWWQPYVLTVGSVTADGRPSPFTAAGPWIGIAAPGEDITSVSNDPALGLANGLPTGDELTPARGTGYAAAYVAGVAALLRSRFPALGADEVTSRLTGTARAAARSPSNLVGAGVVDPVAALTWDVPVDAPVTAGAAVRQLAAPAPPPPRDPLPSIVAFSGVGVLILLVLLAIGIRAIRKDATS